MSRSLFTAMQFSEAVNFAAPRIGCPNFSAISIRNDEVSENQREQERRHRRGNGSGR